MTDDYADTQPQTPAPDLRALDRLIGTWDVEKGSPAYHKGRASTRAQPALGDEDVAAAGLGLAAEEAGQRASSREAPQRPTRPGTGGS